MEDIDVLIAKFLSGEASPEEAMLLEDWKLENNDNLVYYQKLEKINSITGKTPLIQDLEPAHAWKKIRSKIQSEKKVRPLYSNIYLRVAASVLLLVGLGVFFFYFSGSRGAREIAYITDKGNREIGLSDGTQINISAHSNLTIDKDFGVKNRTIRLKGAAYFSVHHEESLPFIVDAGNVYIKDIGTKFNVCSFVDTDTVYVNVDEGVVLLFDGQGATIEIKAKENAMYIKSKKSIVSDSEIKQQNTKLTFSNTRLEEVIEKLNQVYKTNIVFENDDLRNCTITTQFSGEDLNTIMDVITETLGLGYEKTSSGYLIKGRSCRQ